MKKFLLLITIASFTFLTNTQAQIKKNATLLRADIAGSSLTATAPGTVGESKNNDWNFNIGFGKAIRQNLIVGISALYGGYKSGNQTDEQRLRSYGGGFFVRKYQQLGKSDFYLFGTGNLTGSFTKQTYIQASNGQIIKSTNINLAVAPGVAYTVNNWLQLETGLNNLVYFSYQDQKTDIASTKYRTKRWSGGLNVSGASNLYLGLTFLLN